MTPLTPPTCASRRSGLTRLAVTACPRNRWGRSPLNFLVRVVDGLGAVLQLAQPSPHPQRTARVDAGYAPLTQPDQGDCVAAVEELGADPAGAALAIALHAAQRAHHRDLLATFAVDRTLCAGAGDLVGQLF